MKRIFFVLSLLVSLAVKAQVDTLRTIQPFAGYGLQINNLRVPGSMTIPKDTFKLKVIDSGAIAFKDGKIWTWTGYQWNPASVDLSEMIQVSDTSAMLAAYRTGLLGRVRVSDTAAMLLAYRQALAGKLGPTDTTAMLSPYQLGLHARLLLSDTSAMLTAYRNALLLRLRIADTSAMLAAYRTALLNRVPNTRTITINGQTFDLSEDREWTTSSSGGSWGSITGDISNQTDLVDLLNTKVNVSDTAAMLLAYKNALNARLRFTDTTSMLVNYQTAINQRIKYTDSAAMLASYQNAINERASKNTSNIFSADQIIENATSATNGTQQPSYNLILKGQGYKTTATAGSQPVEWRVQTNPIQGASIPAGDLLFTPYYNSTLGGGLTALVGNSAASGFHGLSIRTNANLERAFFQANISTGELKIGTTSGGYFPVIYANGVEAARFNTTGNFGIGTGSTVSARLHTVSTTEQIRVGYNASNYMSITAGSTGSTTFDLTGTTPKFIFSDALQATAYGSGFAKFDGSGNVSSSAITADDVTDGSTNKVFTATEKIKLAGIATGATANSTDAQLRDRSTHTGTQTAATISDFDAEVSNNTDVSAATAHIANTNNPHGVTKAQVGLNNVPNVDATNRANHTGTQTAETISDFQSTVSLNTDLIGKLNKTDTAAMLSAYQAGLNQRQESLYSDDHEQILMAQGNASTFTVLGSVAGITGTVTARSSNATNTFTRHPRFGMVSAAAVNSSAGLRNNNLTASINGGFKFSAVAGVSSTFNVSQSLFIGWTSGIAVIGTTAVPSALTNIFGFGASGGNTTMQFYYNDGSGGADSVSLGASFPVNTASADMYYFEINAPGGGTSVTYKVTNKSTGATTGGTVSSNLPSANTLLSWQMWINTGPNAATAVALDIVKMYCKPLDL
jgi:hypothetical protein